MKHIRRPAVPVLAHQKTASAHPLAARLPSPALDGWSIARTVSLSIGLYLLVLRGLATLIPSYSSQEVATRAASAGWHVILSDPVAASYKILDWLAAHFLTHDLLAARRLSACFGVLALWLFWYIVRIYYNRRVSIMATLLFACSGGFLHAARLGTLMVLQFFILALIALKFYVQRSKHLIFGLYAAAACIATLLYIPGLIWFIMLGAILQYKRILDIVKRLPRQHIAGMAATGLLLIAPLLWGIVQDAEVLRSLAGLPQAAPNIANLPKEFAHFWLALAYRSYYSAEITLHGAAILSVTEIALFLLGLYDILRPPRRKTNYFVVLSLFVVAILVSLGGAVTYAMAIPVVYLVIAAGIRYLLREWLSVFPRNPVARVAGIVFVGLLVAFSIFYQLQGYFVVWPHHEPTHAVFTHTQ